MCQPCVSRVRELVLSEENTDSAFGFELVEYVTTLTTGEIVYLSSNDQFFEISTSRCGDETSIVLQPLPKSRPAVPLADLDEVIGTAITDGELYRITFGKGSLNKTETWWNSAIVLAPEPVQQTEDSFEPIV
jgi:hypothetical protein